jgi:probable F420-dependent oxidoreductase
MSHPTSANEKLCVGFVGFVPGVRRLPELRETVAALESLGVASLWAPGHITIGRDVPESLTGLAMLAALSERATVGTAVLLAPLYHPVIVAKQVAELDRFTGGRVALGVGVGGEYSAEFDACQVEPVDRGPRTDEAIDVLRSLWRGAEVSNPGRFWPFDGVTLAPPPVQRAGPPIIVAGRKGPAMRRAAQRGDGWMPFLYSADRYADSVRRIQLAAAQAERDLKGFPLDVLPVRTNGRRSGSSPPRCGCLHRRSPGWRRVKVCGDHRSGRSGGDARRYPQGIPELHRCRRPAPHRYAMRTRGLLRISCSHLERDSSSPGGTLC